MPSTVLSGLYVLTHSILMVVLGNGLLLSANSLGSRICLSESAKILFLLFTFEHPVNGSVSQK